ncbi:UDP-N-acetylmuramoylalanine--D-glutamate ligase [Vulcanimicrobium alpinum]|uniref:UDP-N-acetylmuramoylalanine--D-glutamate ligase n=1 Tax=Vulcanimicrobium alpinum TaxID=3016050 RepID=A0AAN2CB74_UNVUL|nr:UDP-N-acetylmuramoyl-L-alanine--D-glutamate ligase [Vulcanimicrobium alpinum]BDE07931.1 UDP-N-acetylmuramoylalanine--D-glutamate ligase [Vulcanimicrobium alpinum]
MNVPSPSGRFDRSEHVLVIGLGRSGRAGVAVLRERVGSIAATDEAPRDALGDALAELAASGVPFVDPGALDALLPSLTVAVLSPGIPLNAPIVRRVQAAGVPVFSEVEVAYRICKAPIVAVTGTKGKSTTTALVGALFAAAGKTVHVGGNIGNALIGETAGAAPDDWVIAEVSSFQLESIRSFKPRISLITNITPDHLDRYFSMEEYAEAKFRIFANQGPGDTFVGNYDDEIVRAAPGEDGNRIKSRQLWFASEPHRSTSLYLRGGELIVYAPPTGDPRPIDVMRVDEIPLLGRHNVENAMGAILVALAAGLPLEAVREGVRGFRPLGHRLAPVADVDGVQYVDDSKATNPGAVIAAMRSFDRPIVLIAGGKAKGTEFAEMGKVVSSRAKAVVLIGEAADEIAAVVKRATVERAASMEEAVRRAHALAAPGDIVLLSPGCASFDMFRSAEHRGELFVEAVQALDHRVAGAR